jgi:hypothetical protein
MTKELVIAAYDKDLSWVSDINSDVKTTIYRKGTKTDNQNEIFIEPNIGRCVHTFFNHIYTNYDNLSDLTFFVQDYPFDHWENVIEVANGGLDMCDKHAALTIGGYYGFHFNTIKVHSEKGGLMWTMYPSLHHDRGKIITCNSYGEPQARLGTYNINMNKAWDNFFISETPNMYEFIPGGHFGVTKEHVRLRSREFYKQVVDLLATDVDSPWVIERLECYIFNKKYRTKI